MRFVWLVFLLGCGANEFAAGLEMGPPAGFEWVCTGTTDTVCDTEVGPNRFPPSHERWAVALGSTFALKGNVKPASHGMLSLEASQFRAEREGVVGLILLQDDDVIATNHLRIKKPHAIEVSPFSTPIKLTIGRQREVTARALDEDGNYLAGSLPFEWSTEDDHLIQLSLEPGDNEVSVEGIAAGDAVVSVKMGDQSSVVPVSVALF